MLTKVITANYALVQAINPKRNPFKFILKRKYMK